MNINQFILKNILLIVILAISFNNCGEPEKLPLTQWTYIQVDENRGKWGDEAEPQWLRYFGLALADVNGDQALDIVAGRYWYRNPGGAMTEPWQRIDLGLNVDGMLVVNVDDDNLTDIIAQALPAVYWLEAAEPGGATWKAVKIDTLPKTGHVNGQGYSLAQIIAGGKPEILLQAEGGIYAVEIPANPESGDWGFSLIAVTHSDEGIGTGDIDADGDLDLVAGDLTASGEKEHPTQLKWWENPGTIETVWSFHPIGTTDHAIDRVEVADLNADGRLDVVISEERYPGKEPDASLYWFAAPTDPFSGEWQRQRIITQYSMNNLDVADFDQDGDFDIVTNEHKGQTYKLQIFENDGQGQFTEHLIDTGKESHLGCQAADLDQDGDLDLVSIAWDHYQFLHLWRNDAIKK